MVFNTAKVEGTSKCSHVQSAGARPARRKCRFGLLSATSQDLSPLQQGLRFAVLVTAITSAVMGAVLSVLPALILALVTLFYNSTGGILIFLGSLLFTLPHPVITGHGASTLPVFQHLNSDPVTVLLRSATGTLLCSIAAVVMIVVPRRGRSSRFWLMVTLCCLFAATAEGHSVALSVVPAMAISVGHLIHRWIHRGMART